VPYLIRRSKAHYFTFCFKVTTIKWKVLIIEENKIARRIGKIVTKLKKNYYDLYLTQALKGLARVKTKRIAGRQKLRGVPKTAC